MNEQPLSIILFSGTDDRLEAASVLVAGASAMGRTVHVMLQYWALDAFRADRIRKDHGVSFEAGAEGAWMMRRAHDKSPHHWSETFAQAKELGAVTVMACAKSMELLEITETDLDPIVDGVEGVAAFIGNADGPITFI